MFHTHIAMVRCVDDPPNGKVNVVCCSSSEDPRADLGGFAVFGIHGSRRSRDPVVADATAVHTYKYAAAAQTLHHVEVCYSRYTANIFQTFVVIRLERYRMQMDGAFPSGADRCSSTRSPDLKMVVQTMGGSPLSRRLVGWHRQRCALASAYTGSQLFSTACSPLRSRAFELCQACDLTLRVP